LLVGLLVGLLVDLLVGLLVLKMAGKMAGKWDGSWVAMLGERLDDLWALMWDNKLLVAGWVLLLALHLVLLMMAGVWAWLKVSAMA